MLKTTEIKEKLSDLMIDDLNTPYLVGNSIILCEAIWFDEEKLERNKKDIALILNELDIERKPLVSLKTLTRLKNGEEWNSLQSMDDFHALNLLVACADACQFLENSMEVQQLNAGQLGGNAEIITTVVRQTINNDEEWLKLIRERVLNKVFYLAYDENVKSTISTSHGQNSLKK